MARRYSRARSNARRKKKASFSIDAVRAILIQDGLVSLLMMPRGLSPKEGEAYAVKAENGATIRVETLPSMTFAQALQEVGGVRGLISRLYLKIVEGGRGSYHAVYAHDPGEDLTSRFKDEELVAILIEDKSIIKRWAEGNNDIVALVDVSLAAPPPLPEVEEDEDERGMPSCDAGTDLYVLPMTITQAQNYIQNQILWRSGDSKLNRLVSKAPTFLRAVEAVRRAYGLSVADAKHQVAVATPSLKGVLTDTLRDGKIEDVVRKAKSPETAVAAVARAEHLDEARARARVQAAIESLDAWEKIRANLEAATAKVWTESRRPSFGVYAEYLKNAGKGTSIYYEPYVTEKGDTLTSIGRTRDVQPDLIARGSAKRLERALGKKGVPGFSEKLPVGITLNIPRRVAARSLQDLVLAYYEGGGPKGGYGGSRYYPRLPTYLPVGKKDGVPVVIVLTGSSDDRRGLNLGESELGLKYERAYMGLMGVVSAALWATGAAVARDICILVPPPAYYYKGKEVFEAAGGEDYLLRLAMLYPKMKHLREAYGQSLVSSRSDSKVPLERWVEFSRLIDPQEGGGVFHKQVETHTWQEFYGDVVDVQNWAALFLRVLFQQLLVGTDRPGLLKRMRGLKGQEPVTLQHYIEVAIKEEAAARQKGKGDILSAVAKFGKMNKRLLGMAQTPLPKLKFVDSLRDVSTARERSVTLGDIVPESEARIFFIENTTKGTAGFGMYIPARIVLYETERNRRGEVLFEEVEDVLLVPETVWDDYGELWEDPKARNSLMPLVVATVALVNEERAAATPLRRDLGDEDAKPHPAAVRRTLSRLGLHIPYTQGGQWYLVVPPALKVGDGSFPFGEVDMGSLLGYRQPFTFSKKSKVIDLVRRLLRIRILPGKGGEPILSIQPGKQGSEWESTAVPYFLDQVAAWNKDTSQRYLVTVADDEAAYKKAVKSAFAARGTHERVEAGQMAFGTGREGSGGSSPGQGERAKSGRVSKSSRAAPKGFYSLASGVEKEASELKEQGTSEAAKASAYLHALTRQRWDDIRSHMNDMLGEDGFDSDIEHYEDLREEADFLAGESKQESADELRALADDVEAASLEALEEMLQGGYEVLLPGSLMRPFDVAGGRKGPAVQHQANVLEYIPDDVAEELETIKNPRGRSRRKPRRRRWRERQLRTNPLTSDDLPAIQKWRQGKLTTEELEEKLQLGETDDPAEFVQGIEALFPEVEDKDGGVLPRNAFVLKARLQNLANMGVDVLPSVTTPPVDAGQEEALRERVREGKPLVDAEDQEYLAERSGLTLEDALEVLDARRKGRFRGRTPSGSGASCLRYRGKRRLSGYQPPRDVRSKGTCWILVGPPVSDRAARPLASSRVMIFKNGTHVDCDMVTTRAQPLGNLIGQAIEVLAIWLAERPKRIGRIRYINLGVVGHQGITTLWRWTPEHDWPLSPKAMLKKASEVSGSRSGDVDLAADLENYHDAIRAECDKERQKRGETGESEPGHSAGPTKRKAPKKTTTKRKPRKEASSPPAPPDDEPARPDPEKGEDHAFYFSLSPEELAEHRAKSDRAKRSQFSRWAKSFEEWKGGLEDKEDFEDLSPPEQARLYATAKRGSTKRRGRRR
jgi:hypothetical protein